MSIIQESEIADSELTAARTLHPEDIAVGDHVSLARALFQYPSFLWCGVDTSMLPVERIVELTFLPSEFEMLTVKSICLPFVFCKTTKGLHKVLDVRQVELMKLDEGFAEAVRKGERRNAKSSSENRAKRKRKQKSK